MSQEKLKPPPVPRCPKCGFASGGADFCDACGANLPAVRPYLVRGPGLAGAPRVKRVATGGWLAPVLFIFASGVLVLGGLWYYFAPQLASLRSQTVITDSAGRAPAPTTRISARLSGVFASVFGPETKTTASHAGKRITSSRNSDDSVGRVPALPLASTPEPRPRPSPSPLLQDPEAAAKAQALVSAVGQLLRTSSGDESEGRQAAVEPTPDAVSLLVRPRPRDPKAPIMLSEASFSTGRAWAAGNGTGASRSGLTGSDARRAIAAWGGGVQVASTPYASGPSASAPSSAPTAGVHVLDLTDQTFTYTVGQSSEPVVVDFWAPWCSPCRKFQPVLEEAARTYGGRVRFARVNVDENKALARRFSVEALPTVIVFKSGSARYRTEGAMDQRSFGVWVDAATR